ncbi:TraR/DksA family transcriptional regulator [Patescibacteria group bacterium]|nr:TraR/DksA family transcriptional regulator [Patescibacteria group bacterium]MBU1563569.1 TraR/DksA family transcriptional regulator [Patescibacteria group bacterium]MBU2068307.1 TraR/DksA family transcriptional regulator [Patescibacteria group bacterium]
MDKKELKQLKKLLEIEKKKLTKDLSSFAEKDPKRKWNWLTNLPFLGEDHSSVDENAERIEAYETLLPIEHTLEIRLKKIEEALIKMNNGKYGICEACSLEIEPKRLEVVPEAKRCIKCKEKNV